MNPAAQLYFLVFLSTITLIVERAFSGPIKKTEEKDDLPVMKTWESEMRRLSIDKVFQLVDNNYLIQTEEKDVNSKIIRVVPGHDSNSAQTLFEFLPGEMLQRNIGTNAWIIRSMYYVDQCLTVGQSGKLKMVPLSKKCLLELKMYSSHLRLTRFIKRSESKLLQRESFDTSTKRSYDVNIRKAPLLAKLLITSFSKVIESNIWDLENAMWHAVSQDKLIHFIDPPTGRLINMVTKFSYQEILETQIMLSNELMQQELLALQKTLKSKSKNDKTYFYDNLS